ncbi:MAG: class I SAM-dependent methyltransferase [Pseudonocardiales bacterium]|nr:MAG: class I SAM-dependent methyltransferase [Pseudonocardiales bacterium]
MPIMPVGERVFCRTAFWGVLARRLVLPWVLSGLSVAGDVLEIGGGGGAMAAGTLGRYPTVRVCVADLDPMMVRATARRLAGFGSRATTQVGDATALPFDDASFDVVVSYLMLHHIGRWEDAVVEAMRVLRPGGRFVGYDLLDTAASRALHHADGIHDLRSITEPSFRAALTAAGAVQPRLRPGLLTLRWVATKPG